MRATVRGYSRWLQFDNAYPTLEILSKVGLSQSWLLVFVSLSVYHKFFFSFYYYLLIFNISNVGKNKKANSYAYLNNLLT